MANALMTPQNSGESTAPSPNGDKKDVIVVPFSRGAVERTDPFHDTSTQLATSARQVGPVDVLARGFARHLVLEVTASGGAGGGAVAEEDAPFSVFDEVALLDVNGDPICQLTGYECFVANKYGRWVPLSDARALPSFSAVDANGDFTFRLRIPIEISGRDGFGALLNENASQTYKLRYTLAPAGNIYSTSPVTTLPSVRVKASLESWTKPREVDLFGNPVARKPPAHGSQQFLSHQVYNIDSGQQTVRLSRVGNHIRLLAFILRTGAAPGGARSTSDWPSEIELLVDGNVIDNLSRTHLRDRMAERYRLDGADNAAQGLDAGVFVWDFAHDLDGEPGHELRDGYLRTTPATDLSIRGQFGGTADQLVVLTNDVAVTAPFQAS